MGTVELATTISFPTSTSGIIDLLKKRPKNIGHCTRICIEPAALLVFVKSSGETAIFVIMKMRSYSDVQHLQNRAMIHVQIYRAKH